MDETNQKTAAFENLSEVRARIDAIDDALLQNLIDRSALIEAVQTFKAQARQPQANAMRPGRETLTLRRLIAQAGDKLPPELVLRIWREIVSWATQVQNPMGVHICAPQDDTQFWDYVRGHFGAFARIERHDTMDGVLKALADKPRDVAVLPAGSGDAEGWLGALVSKGDVSIKIAGCLPLIGKQPEAYVLGAMEVEATGDDCSLIYVAADPKRGAPEIKTAVDEVGLEIVSLMPSEIISPEGGKTWLVICRDHYDQIADKIEQLGKSGMLNAANYIGGYPTPIDVSES